MTGFIDPSVRAARVKEQRNRHPKDRPMSSSPEIEGLLTEVNRAAHSAGTNAWVRDVLKRAHSALRASLQPATPTAGCSCPFDGCNPCPACVAASGGDAVAGEALVNDIASRSPGVSKQTIRKLLAARDEAPDAAATPSEPVAWRYKCRDGSEVLFLKRLTDEQKRRGYYTSEDGEDEVDGDEAVVGPFHWAEETPLYAGVAQPTRALADVAAERERQITQEGWTSIHDDQHDTGEMARAAASYALSAGPEKVSDLSLIHKLWPWEWRWFKPRSKREDLVRAGALIVAEIERLDRASPISSTNRETIK